MFDLVEELADWDSRIPVPGILVETRVPRVPILIRVPLTPILVEVGTIPLRLSRTGPIFVLLRLGPSENDLRRRAIAFSFRLIEYLPNTV